MENNKNKITEEELTILSETVMVGKEKLRYYIEKYGLEAVLNEPWKMDINEEQMLLFATLKNLMSKGV